MQEIYLDPIPAKFYRSTGSGVRDLISKRPPGRLFLTKQGDIRFRRKVMTPSDQNKEKRTILFADWSLSEKYRDSKVTINKALLIRPFLNRLFAEGFEIFVLTAEKIHVVTNFKEFMEASKNMICMHSEKIYALLPKIRNGYNRDEILIADHFEVNRWITEYTSEHGLKPGSVIMNRIIFSEDPAVVNRLDYSIIPEASDLRREVWDSIDSKMPLALPKHGYRGIYFSFFLREKNVVSIYSKPRDSDVYHGFKKAGFDLTLKGFKCTSVEKDLKRILSFPDPDTVNVIRFKCGFTDPIDILDNLKKLLDRFINLKKLYFQQCTIECVKEENFEETYNVEILELSEVIISYKNLFLLLRMFPNLKQLVISECVFTGEFPEADQLEDFSLESVRYLKLDIKCGEEDRTASRNCYLAEVLMRCPNVIELELSKARLDFQYDRSQRSWITYPFKFLKKLTLKDHYEEGEYILKVLIARANSLDHLILDNVYFIGKSVSNLVRGASWSKLEFRNKFAYEGAARRHFLLAAPLEELTVSDLKYKAPFSERDIRRLASLYDREAGSPNTKKLKKLTLCCNKHTRSFLYLSGLQPLTELQELNLIVKSHLISTLNVLCGNRASKLKRLNLFLDSLDDEFTYNLLKVFKDSTFIESSSYSHLEYHKITEILSDNTLTNIQKLDTLIKLALPQLEKIVWVNNQKIKEKRSPSDRPNRLNHASSSNAPRLVNTSTNLFKPNNCDTRIDTNVQPRSDSEKKRKKINLHIHPLNFKVNIKQLSRFSRLRVINDLEKPTEFHFKAIEIKKSRRLDASVINKYRGQTGKPYYALISATVEESNDWQILPSYVACEEAIEASCDVDFEIGYDDQNNVYGIRFLETHNRSADVNLLIKTNKLATDFYKPVPLDEKILEPKKLKKIIHSIIYKNFKRDTWIKKYTAEEWIAILYAWCSGFGEPKINVSIKNGSNIENVKWLAENRVGACRHRVWVFQYLASLLGIDATKISNGRHAYISFKLNGEVCWMNLGGYPSHDYYPSTESLNHLRNLTKESEYSIELPEAMPDEETHFTQETRESPDTNVDDELVLTTPTEDRYKPFQLHEFEDKSSIESFICDKAVELVGKNKKYFIIDSVDAILEQFTQARVNENTVERFPGPLLVAIQDENTPVTLIIDWSSLEPEAITMLNSLFDKKAYLNGERVRAPFEIISLMDGKTRDLLGDDFKWRHSVSDSNEEVGRSGPLVALPNLQLRPVKLYGETALFQAFVDGKFIKRGTETQYIESELKLAIQKGEKGICFINPPNTREFHLRRVELLNQGGFYANGEWLEIPESFMMDFVSVDVTLDLNCLASISYYSHADAHYYPLNQSTIDYFHEGFVVKEDGMHFPAGLLEAHKDGALLILVTEKILLGQWERLFEAANQYNVKLTIELANEMALPEVLANALTETPTYAEPIQHLPSTGAVIMTTNNLKAATEALNRDLVTDNCNPHWVSLTELTSDNDIFENMSVTEDGNHIDIHPTSIFQWLMQGDTVVLHGKPSHELLQQLQTLFLKKPYIYLKQHREEGQVLPFSGRLILLAEHTMIPRTSNLSHYHLVRADGLKTNSNQLAYVTNDKEGINQRRLEAITNHLYGEPMVFIEGPTAAGKTYTVTQLLPDYYKQMGYQVRVFSGPHAIDGFLAEAINENAAELHLLILDEADLLPKETIERLNGLLLPTPGISNERGEFQALRGNKKVLMMGNGKDFQGRAVHEIFERNKIIFEALPAWFFESNVLAPLLDDLDPKGLYLDIGARKTLLTEFIQVFEAKQWSARNLQMQAMERCVPDTGFIEFDALVDKVRSVKGYILTNSRELILKQCYDFLRVFELRKMKPKKTQKRGLRGLLLQGATGSGKTELLNALIEAMGYQVISLSDEDEKGKATASISAPDSNSDIQQYCFDLSGCVDVEKLEATLAYADKHGCIVIINELNSFKLEKALNDYLTGERHDGSGPGLILFATQNNAGKFFGRDCLSPAYLNRLKVVNMSGYPKAELQSIFTMQGYNRELLTDFFKTQPARMNYREAEQQVQALQH